MIIKEQGIKKDLITDIILWAGIIACYITQMMALIKIYRYGEACFYEPNKLILNIEIAFFGAIGALMLFIIIDYIIKNIRRMRNEVSD